MVDPRAVAFGMPRVRDLLGAEKEPRPTAGPAPADLLYLLRADLDASLADVVEVAGHPPGDPGLLFVPWGGAALGVPYCPPREDLECWPVRGGLDDNPFAWVCVCESPRIDDDQSPLDISGPCQLDFQVTAEGPRWVCRNDTCRGECRLVIALGKPKLGKPFEPFVLSCQCQRRAGSPETPVTGAV